MARLRLISLERFHLEQWNDDVEPYLLVNGKYFWESTGDKESRKIEFSSGEVIDFTAQAIIELKDGERLRGDGQLLARIAVKEEQAGKGEFDHFIQACGMIYKLTYEVLR